MMVDGYIIGVLVGIPIGFGIAAWIASRIDLPAPPSQEQP